MVQATSIGEYYEIEAVGPAAQLLVAPAQLGFAATVPANGSIASQPMPGNGYKAFAVGVTSTAAGVVSIQRYLNAGATIAQSGSGNSSATSASLVAGTPTVLNITDGLPYTMFTITVTNTTGSVAALSNVVVLLQAS